MKGINHVTLNTGHSRISYPHEIDKSMYFMLKRILSDSFTVAGADLYHGYRLKSTQTDIATIATLYAADGVPVLTTTCTNNDTNGDIWRLLHNVKTPLKTDPEHPPELPYIADRLEVGAFLHMDALQWTGDFARCFGWVVLAPNKIR